MSYRRSADVDAGNCFRCSCGTLHAFGDTPGFRRIEHSHQYADCTVWTCPGCGRQHDSRQFTTFGGMFIATAVAVDPDTHHPMIRYAGRWHYPDGPVFVDTDGGPYVWSSPPIVEHGPARKPKR